MIVDKEYCMSSFLTFRYVEDEQIIFKEGIVHQNYKPVPQGESTFRRDRFCNTGILYAKGDEGIHSKVCGRGSC